MSKIVRYLLHDPIANVEGELATFDVEELRAAEDAGMVLIAVYDDEHREVVHADDVEEPVNQSQSFTFVTPTYVNDRLNLVCDVFDAIGSASSQGSSGGLGTQSDENLFEVKLNALKELLNASEDGSQSDGGGVE